MDLTLRHFFRDSGRLCGVFHQCGDGIKMVTFLIVLFNTSAYYLSIIIFTTQKFNYYPLYAGCDTFLSGTRNIPELFSWCRKLFKEKSPEISHQMLPFPRSIYVTQRFSPSLPSLSSPEPSGGVWACFVLFYKLTLILTCMVVGFILSFSHIW